MALEFGDLLDGGRVLAAGKPQQVLQEDLLRRVYGVEVLRAGMQLKTSYCPGNWQWGNLADGA